MRLTVSPTPVDPPSVTLPNFWSTLGSGSAFLRWETATELDSLNFYIERADSPTGLRIRIDADLIPSQQPGRVIYATGEFVDNVVASHPTPDDSHAIVEPHVAHLTDLSFIVPIGVGACLPSVDR